MFYALSGSFAYTVGSFQLFNLKNCLKFVSNYLRDSKLPALNVCYVLFIIVSYPDLPRGYSMFQI